MRWNSWFATAAILVAFGAVPVIAAEPTAPVVVQSTRLDEATDLLTIRGRGFGDVAPHVTFAGLPLTVLDHSPEEILVRVPDVLPGTYLLLVARNPLRVPFYLFDVTVGAVGPQGEPGETGATGPPGPPGPDHSKTLAELEARVERLGREIGELTDRLRHFSRSGNDVIIEGANVHVRSGSGSTTAANGLGNLVVGYNEPRAEATERSGSHNLVVGTEHNYSSYGGLAVGSRGSVAAPYASSIAGASFDVRTNTIDLQAGVLGRLQAGATAELLGGIVTTVRGAMVKIN